MPTRCLPIFLALTLAACAGSPARQATRTRLREIRIDQIRFDRAKVTDAISFL